MQPLAKINLTTHKVDSYDIPTEYTRQYLGGASLAARLLYPYLSEQLNPLAPEAPLLFLNGPLSGTSGPTTGRTVVCAKSPATGLWGESNFGGFWGHELRRAGFDGVWITGKAKTPVYLWINDGLVEIRPAGHLWGQDTYQIQETLREELDQGKVRVAGIGIAGESQIPYSLILTDHGRVAGRTGMGAIMGAKNLKAVAVKGSHAIPVSDPEGYQTARSEANRALRDDTFTLGIRETGTAGVADYLDYLGEMPKKGFREGVMEGSDLVSGATMAETILEGVSACHACVVACGRVVKLNGKEKRQKGPEYETAVGFGPNLWLKDLSVATEMGDLCDRYGLDTISTSNVIGLAMTLFEKGVITEKDTGGLTIEWGDAEVVNKLVKQIAYRQGFGAHLAEGALAVARRYGAAEEAVQVNGLEVPYHDPRGATGMALVYATSPRGACHNQSDFFLVEIGQAEEELGIEFTPRESGLEKAANVARHQNWRTVFNAAIICFFGNVAPLDVVDLINKAAGLDWTIEEMMRSGERGWNLKRAINNRLGLTRENDILPKTLLDPYIQGGAAGVVIDLHPMLQAYYEARDWDWSSGRPSRQLLIDLDLEFLVDDLWPRT